MRDVETIDSKLRLVRLPAVRLGSGVGRCRRSPWRMLMDERRELTERATTRGRNFTPLG